MAPMLSARILSKHEVSLSFSIGEISVIVIYFSTFNDFVRKIAEAIICSFTKSKHFGNDIL